MSAMCPIFLPGGLDVRRSKTVDSVLRASRWYPARFASACAACVAMRASSFRCAAVHRFRVLVRQRLRSWCAATRLIGLRERARF